MACVYCGSCEVHGTKPRPLVNSEVWLFVSGVVERFTM